MNFGTKSLSLITLSTATLLFVGCSNQSFKLNQPKKVEKKVEKKVKKKVVERILKDQKLSINASVLTKAPKEDIYYKYKVLLNNTDKSKAKIEIKNRGEKPLIISNVIPKNFSRFLTYSNHCQTPLQADEVCNIDVAFIGKSKGEFKSSLEIISNDKKNRITNILLEIKTEDKYHASISPKAQTIIKQKKTLKLKFNALNKTQYIQVKNDGFEDLKLKAPIRSGKDATSFTYTTNCKKTLKVDEKCEVAVVYDPSKKEGYSDATIKIPSNGRITPSRYIRLEGYSKPFSIKIEKFIISDNVGDFVDDYFSSNKTYFFRTIYQNNTDRFFTEGVNKEIKNYFNANNFKLASSANTADKIITIYPSVKTVVNEANNDIRYNIVINGYLTTKAKNIKTHPSTDLTLDYKSAIGDTRFSAITLNNTVFSKEKFQFGLDIQVDNVADSKEVASTVADLTVSKLFNVLGLKDTKGTK